MADFLMPSLGADMEDGVITEWKAADALHVDVATIEGTGDTFLQKPEEL